MNSQLEVGAMVSQCIEYEQKHPIKTVIFALAKLLSWLERHPMHEKDVSLFPSQGTYQGCGFDP